MMRISQQWTGAIQCNRMAHSGLCLQEQSWRSFHLPPKCLGIVGKLAHHRLHAAVELGGCKPEDTQAELSIDTMRRDDAQPHGRTCRLTASERRVREVLTRWRLSTFWLGRWLSWRQRTAPAVQHAARSKHIDMLHQVSCKLTDTGVVDCSDLSALSLLASRTALLLTCFHCAVFMLPDWSIRKQTLSVHDLATNSRRFGSCCSVRAASVLIPAAACKPSTQYIARYCTAVLLFLRQCAAIVP